VVRSQVNETHMDLEAEVPETIARRLKLDEFVVKGTSRSSAAYRK
jgi:hypothetical protein